MVYKIIRNYQASDTIIKNFQLKVADESTSKLKNLLGHAKDKTAKFEMSDAYKNKLQRFEVNQKDQIDQRPEKTR